MNNKKVVFSRHAIEQMFFRSITHEEIFDVINNGEVIKSYPDDKPYPSNLIFKNVNSRPIHIVASKNENEEIIIITTYIPDKSIWTVDFKTRK